MNRQEYYNQDFFKVPQHAIAITRLISIFSNFQEVQNNEICELYKKYKNAEITAKKIMKKYKLVMFNFPEEMSLDDDDEISVYTPPLSGTYITRKPIKHSDTFIETNPILTDYNYCKLNEAIIEFNKLNKNY